MTIKAVRARCINCKTEAKEDHEFCTKCGDRVKARVRLERELKETLTEHTVSSQRRAAGIRRELATLDTEDAAPERSDVTLTPEQESALARIADWYEQADGRGWVFRLFGAAGVGKTTIVKHLARALGTPDIVYGAYTGKAAHVLRRKGVPATTIHSAIYRPVDNAAARAEWGRVTCVLADIRGGRVLMGSDRVARLESELAELEEAIRHGVEFELNPMAEWADADLIVLDEVSMVNEKIALDVQSFGVPVLVLGDPYQLPPVEGGGYWTAHRPDVLLTEVHRQALESPVLALATAVRKGGGWDHMREKVSLEAAMAADQILVWKNSTRHTLTAKIREKLGRPAGVPVPGDRVMCLVNNKDIGVFNGQQFEVLNVDPDSCRMFLRDDEGHELVHYYDPDGFRGLDGEKEMKARRRHAGRVGAFTFANVITVHKAQGSEWDHVYLVDQTDQMWKSTRSEKARWVYTGITRASDRITIAHTGL